MRQILPAYPIFIKDPFYSLWSQTDSLNHSNIVNWQGIEKPIYGIIYSKGKSYSFLGDVPNSIKLEQTSVEISAFETKYYFTSETFDLNIEFLSPLPPDDLELLSTPVCFMHYEVTPKMDDFTFKLALFVSEKVSYNYQINKDTRSRGDVMKMDKFELAYIGADEQKILSHSADVIGADWGYYYISGEECYFSSEESINSFMNKGKIIEQIKGQEKYIISVNQTLDGKVLVAFDDVCSIYYFGELLRGYYFRSGKNIMNAIEESYIKYNQIMNQCQKFDLDLIKKASQYGAEYIHILRAALRQSVGAHKLVQDTKGRKLFLSKECGSDGCIATVDVSYPSMPLYLMYNPDLVLGMLYPIFDFAKKPVWNYEFAPHDAGVYPYCNGQFYGVKVQKSGPYHRDIGYLERDCGVLPMYYLYSKGSDIYESARQMPVEECGNMIIMTALFVKSGGDKNLVKEFMPLLNKWADYLLKKGLVPENQLCTDDFAGYLDKNINLAIKATISLAAFDKLQKEFEIENGNYLAEAKSRAREISKYSTHIPLTFNLGEETYSLKYNLYCDQLLETQLFDKKVLEKEMNHYLLKANKYGIPLDNRATYTKSDWLLWTASLTENKDAQQKIIKQIYDYLHDTQVRVPFSDWYDTIRADAPLPHLIFKNRTVQGGLFAILCKDKLLSK